MTGTTNQHPEQEHNKFQNYIQMKCTLHIGTAKTGTTSIQSFFYQNRKELFEKYRIHYPEFIPYFQTGVSHRALSYYAAGEKLLDDPKWPIKTAEDKLKWQSEFRKYFRRGIKCDFSRAFISKLMYFLRILQPCEHYFFSSEHLHSRITKQSQVSYIVDLLSEFFDQIDIIIFLKPQSSLAVSRHSTLLKSGKVKDDLFSSTMEKRVYYNYNKFLGWWTEILGEKSINIRIMDDKSSASFDSIDEICKILGVDKNSFSVPPVRENQYLSAQSLIFLNILNRQINEEKLKVSTNLRKSIVHSLKLITSPERLFPARDCAMNFDKKYAASNRSLAKRLKVDDPLFMVDYSKYPMMQTVVPNVKVQDVFEHVADKISKISLDENDRSSWSHINHYFSNRMKINKISSEYGPDYACVGFPKCATTFILKRFSEYSFDTLVKGEFQMSRIEEYRQKIKDIHDQGIKVAIKNPNIIYTRDSMDQLQKSGCKIIISIRNPVRWIKSFYNYRLKRIDQGQEHLPDNFEKIPEFGEIVSNSVNFMGVSLKRGMMAKIINKNLFESEHYDPSRVLFVIQEEFEAEHEKVQAELLDFLEIPNDRRLNRDYNFDYNKPKRWKFFNDDEHDAELYEIYKNEIRDICSLIHSQTGKDLKSIWENFYSIKIDL